MKRVVSFYREEYAEVVVEGDTEEAIKEAAQAEIDNGHLDDYFTDHTSWGFGVSGANDDATCYTEVRDGEFADKRDEPGE
jgi:hypothetical protein